MITPKGRPGFGDKAIIYNSDSGKTWEVVVLYWGITGCPFTLDTETAARRWFPPHWVAIVEPGDGPRACSCRVVTNEVGPERFPDLGCDVHVSEQRRKELSK